VSTPIFDEAGLCDRVALIHNGKILSINTPQGIAGQLSAITKEVKRNPFLGIQTFLYSDTKTLLYGKTWSIAAWRYCNGK